MNKSTSKPAELLKAVRLLSMGEPFLAERTATEGLRRYPSHGQLLQVRGIARHYLLHLGPAVADLEEAMVLVPLDPLAIWCLADAYETQHRRDLARPLARWLIARNDTPPRLYPRLGQMLARLGEDEFALQAWEEHDRLEPNQATSFFHMGYLMSRLGYSHRIIRSRLRRAVELDPQMLSYRIQCALVDRWANIDGGHEPWLESIEPSEVDCPHLAARVARAFELSQEPLRASLWWDRSIELVRDPAYHDPHE